MEGNSEAWVCTHTCTHPHSHVRTHTLSLLLRNSSAHQHHPQTCPLPRGTGPSPLPSCRALAQIFRPPPEQSSQGPAGSLTSAAPTHGHTWPHTPHFHCLLPNIQDLPSWRKPRLLLVVIKALGIVTDPRTGFPTSTPHTSTLQATNSTTGRILEMTPTSRLTDTSTAPRPYTGIPQFTHPLQPSSLTPVDRPHPTSLLLFLTPVSQVPPSHLALDGRTPRLEAPTLMPPLVLSSGSP